MRWFPSKSRLIRSRDRFIHATNMTWPALYAAIGFTLTWIAWNVMRDGLQFDPFPFILLGVAITIYTWWQNYLILIWSESQRQHDDKQEAANEVMLRTILHVAEGTRDLLEKRNVANPRPGAAPGSGVVERENG